MSLAGNSTVLRVHETGCKEKYEGNESSLLDVKWFEMEKRVEDL